MHLKGETTVSSSSSCVCVCLINGMCSVPCLAKMITPRGPLQYPFVQCHVVRKRLTTPSGGHLRCGLLEFVVEGVRNSHGVI